MDEPQQTVRVALDPYHLQAQGATRISEAFAEECATFFASGGTSEGMYGLVLQRRAFDLARQQITTI